METVEEEEQYEDVANTVTTIKDKNNNEEQGRAEDESDIETSRAPTAPQYQIEDPLPYDPMRDAPPPRNIGPSHRPLLKKNEQWGDTCLPKSMYVNECI